VLKKNFREDSEYIGAALNNLGSYLAGAQKYEEALPIVQEVRIRSSGWFNVIHSLIINMIGS